MGELNEQIVRMKQLMGEDRLFGNLVKNKSEDDILKEEWYDIKKNLFGLRGELLENDDKLFNSVDLLVEGLFDSSKTELLVEQKFKSLLFKPRLKGRKIKMGDMTLGSGSNPFKNLKSSGLSNATYKNVPELLDVLKKNKVPVLNAMKNTGVPGWNNATIKHVDDLILEMEELMTNADKYLDNNYKFSPAKTNMSSRSKTMMFQLPTDMYSDILDSIEFLGKRQKITNFISKIKKKGGDWYTGVKKFFNKLFKKTNSTGLKSRWSSKIVSSTKLTDKELMAQFVTGLRKSLDETGVNLRGRIKNMEPGNIINELPSNTLDGLKKGQSVGGLLFRKVDGKYELVRQITFIDEVTGKRQTKQLMNDEFMEMWLEQGTIKGKKPDTKKLISIPWWKKGNTKGKNRNIPGKNIFKYIGRLLSLPFPAGSTIVRFGRETLRKAVGKGDYSRIWSIGNRKNIKQFSDILKGDGSQNPILGFLARKIQIGEIGVRIGVETLIYATGYGLYEQMDPNTSKVNQTKDFIKGYEDIRNWEIGLIKLGKLIGKVKKEAEEMIKNFKLKAESAYCMEKFPKWESDSEQKVGYDSCLKKIRDAKDRINKFVQSKKDLLVGFNSGDIDCSKINNDTWTNITSEKKDVEAELDTSVPYWSDIRDFMKVMKYGDSLEKMKKNMFPDVDVPAAGDGNQKTETVDWDSFIVIAKQRWVEVCMNTERDTDKHGDGGQSNPEKKENSDDASKKCSCKDDNGNTIEYDCDSEVPEACDMNQFFSHINVNLPDVEVIASQYDYNPNIKIEFTTALIDNIALLDESDFT